MHWLGDCRINVGHIGIISQNDRCKNALNAPQFFAVLAAQAQFLDALLKRSEEFLQLFVANFALQCLEARLSFRSRQRIFRSACKCMQEHRKNGIFWRTNSSTEFKAEHEASPSWDVTGLHRLGHLSVRERRGNIMVYHSICVHQIQKCIIVYRHKGFSKWWICPEASFPSSEWTNRIIQGNKWRQAILSFVGLHHWLAAVSLLNTQNLCVVSCRFAKCRTVLLFIENILRPQAMAMCCISHEAWLCHTCSIRQSRHMLTWEVNSQVIHRLCCFLLQAKPVRLQHSIARCCTMHGGFNPPWLKTLSEDYDNQTRVCQKHGFSSPKFMFHCRWVHLTRNAWRLETKGIKMPLTLSSSLRCSIFFIIGSSQNVFTLFPGVSAFEWALTLAEKQSCIHQGS